VCEPATRPENLRELPTNEGQVQPALIVGYGNGPDTRFDNPTDLDDSRGKVMLDRDLAELYSVETRVLVQAVKRNAERFPDDFMFQLNETEHASLRSQTVILQRGRGRHVKFRPYVFTEHGALMLGNVLRSPSAVSISVLIVRAFVQFRAVLANHEELSKKLDQLEKRVLGHDSAIRDILQAIRVLTTIPTPPKRPIGFTSDMEKK
jgi:ORF6N domain